MKLEEVKKIRILVLRSNAFRQIVLYENLAIFLNFLRNFRNKNGLNRFIILHSGDESWKEMHFCLKIILVFVSFPEWPPHKKRSVSYISERCILFWNTLWSSNNLFVYFGIMTSPQNLKQKECDQFQFLETTFFPLSNAEKSIWNSKPRLSRSLCNFVIHRDESLVSLIFSQIENSHRFHRFCLPN